MTVQYDFCMLDEHLKASEFCLQVVHSCSKQSIALSVCLSIISANRPKEILGAVLVAVVSLHSCI